MPKKPLTGTVQKAAPGLNGFDLDQPLSRDIAQQFYNRGYRFCVRYISLGQEWEGDLSYSEANQILEAGLALMPVQHPRYPGWAPSTSMGRTLGQQAAINAYSVGFPAGVNVWCDLEGVSLNSSSWDVIEYCNAWYDAVAQWGYAPGLYVGYNSFLSSEQLYYSLKFSHYWKSMSDVPEVYKRGYQLIQSATETVNGIRIDPDTTKDDNLGGSAIWLVRQ